MFQKLYNVGFAYVLDLKARLAVDNLREEPTLIDKDGEKKKKKDPIT